MNTHRLKKMQKALLILLIIAITCGAMFSGCSSNTSNTTSPSRIVDSATDDTAVPAETEELFPPPTESVDYNADAPETSDN